MGPIEQTLVAVADAVEGAADRWWVIAGAATWLHGVRGTPPRDVDLLMSERDIRRLGERIGLSPAPGRPSARFRSALFLRWLALPLSVEAMAGFELCRGGDWHPVQLQSRQTVSVAGRTLFIPAREELATMLRAFGRPKDHRRAAQLTAPRDAT